MNNMNVLYSFSNLDSKNHIYDSKYKHTDTTTKCYFILINYVFEMLNMTANNTFIKSMEGQKLYEIKNIDIFGTPIRMTTKILEKVTFIPTTVKNPMYFIYEKPLIAFVHNIYTLPYDSKVWISSLGMSSVFLVIIYFLIGWEYIHPELKKLWRPNVTEVCIEEIGIISQQGTELEPKSIGGGLVLIIKLFSYMFLFLAYAASIITLIQSRADVANSVDDLKYSGISLGIENDTTTIELFKTEEDPARRSIYHRKIAPPHEQPRYYTIEDGINKMHNEYFAFHIQEQRSFHQIKNTFTESEICCLKSVDFLRAQEPLIALQKNSSLIEDFKKGMMVLHQVGILNREFLRLSPKKPRCLDTENDFVIVGFLHCYTAFLLYATGVALSLIIFGCEIIIYRYNQDNRRRKINIY